MEIHDNLICRRFNCKAVKQWLRASQERANTSYIKNKNLLQELPQRKRMLREEEGGSGAKERGFERSARRVGHRRAEVPAAERELLRGAVPQ